MIIGSELPNLSGIDICSRLRATGSLIPIIFLDQANTSHRQANALKIGIDAYISTPLNLEVFIAQVSALLKRVNYQDSIQILSYADVVLNYSSRTVYRGGHELSLTAKEFDLLAYFLEHPQQVLSKTQILDAVWSYDCDLINESNVLQFYVCSLRKKLEAIHKLRIIHTMRGIGYVLKCPHEKSRPNSLITYPTEILGALDRFQNQFEPFIHISS